MFVAREKELKLLGEVMSKPTGSVMIYGKRKVGKTTLITHALKNSKDAYDIYEVKYHADITPKKEMEKEAEKIRNLKGLNVGQIGFISVMGCEEYENDYLCISGGELYK